MKKAIVFIAIIILIAAACGDKQNIFELSKTDIISLGKPVSFENLAVRGIRVGMPFEEALQKLGKTEKDMEPYLLIPENGFTIVKGDDSTVNRIKIDGEFVGLTGKMKEFFVLQSKESAKTFLVSNFGEPLKTDDRSTSYYLAVDFYYAGGLSFTFFKQHNGNAESIFEIVAQKKGALENEVASLKPTLEDGKFDFRKTTWEATKDKVKQTEKLKIVYEEDDMLIYEETLLGFPVTLVYVFNENRLARGAYNFNQSHTNMNDYIEDFKKVKMALTEKYGSTQLDFENWKNPLYKKNPEKFGFAISIGHLEYISRWENDRTAITLSLTGDNYKIKFRLILDAKGIEIKQQDESDKF